MHVAVFALLGGLLGAFFLNGYVGGFLTGVAFGVLVAWLGELRRRIGELERHAAEAAERALRESPAGEGGPRDRRAVEGAPQTGAVAAPSGLSDRAAPREAPARAEHPRPAASAEPLPWERRATPARAARSAAEGPDLLERALERVKAWFTTGNVPVKVGVVLSVFGVGFLVKEAIDRNWMFIPLELRLMLVALFALALLVVGWRLRESRPAYAVSVQGGGIAMLYVTIYAAFALYDLLPTALAFAMLLVVTLAGGALAVLQDSRSLAVLGIVGGFMAPVLTSSGTGNHVALFGYYAVLDLAIFGIAWFKAWRVLNVLGFAFTFGIGSLWGYEAYRPELFASTEPFLVLFVLLYTLIPVLFASRESPELKGFVDGTLVFGTPIVGFALQSRLVGDTEYGLAASAVALAALHVVLARWIHRRGGQAQRVLAEAQLGLGLVFLAIAVPLALDARWTSAAWAVQGAAMIWLGVRQRRRLAFLAGTALQLAAGAALLADSSYRPDEGSIGATLLGAVLIALAGAFSGWCLDRVRATKPTPRGVAAGLFLTWAAAWWLWGGIVEIDRLVRGAGQLNAFLIFVGATVLAATFAAPRVDWSRLNAVGLLALPVIALAAMTSPIWQTHALAGFGWAAWLVLFTAHYVFLERREAQFPRWQPPAHAVAHWAMAYLLAFEIGWQVGQVADGAWPGAAGLAGAAAFVLLTMRERAKLAWPLAAHRRTYVLPACGGVLAVLVAVMLTANVFSPGTGGMLPYVPLVNPLELASVFVVLVLIYWWRVARAESPHLELRPQVAALGSALLGLFLLTMSVARAVHHWGGVPFDLELLAGSIVLQAALSIVWGFAALAGMLLGARSRRREIWLAGAALMGIVVAKLFIVELGSAGTVGRVVSFLGVGSLLLVVGYFAPVPPRAELRSRQA